MPTTKPTAPRKRNRKRKRRLASSSSSSSSSDSASSDETPVKKAPLKKQATPSSAEEPSSSSSSSSPSSSDSEHDDAPHESNALPAVSRVPFVKTQGVKARSPSPSPPPVGLPPFLPSEGSGSRADEEEQALRNRFRQFWMASVADAFSDDLERIRKEPSMTKSRLALLIDSLASGGEVFSSRAGERGEMNEMEVVLNSNHDD
ncbi:hypothetical protein EDB85DRAFT_1945084 [Lactarius pseudohatsudake]|nr:hypothetical protein EDB85DRAFT_1945084 [Lactarius pseudohatsudake]